MATADEQPDTVSKLIETAFGLARSRALDLATKWHDVSYKIGPLIGNSLLVANIQRYGDIDLVLRCMEDEAAPIVAGAEGDLPSAHYQLLLSELWIGSMYEVFRALRARKLVGNPPNQRFTEIERHLKLIRIPVEKYELADDRELTSAIQMARYPRRDNDMPFIYDKKDSARAHIMPTALSFRGSFMWMVSDLMNQTEYWVERRNLSDRVIDYWTNPNCAAAET